MALACGKTNGKLEVANTNQHMAAKNVILLCCWVPEFILEAPNLRFKHIPAARKKDMTAVVKCNEMCVLGRNDNPKMCIFSVHTS